MLLINHAIYSVLVIAASISSRNVINVFAITTPFKNHMKLKGVAKTPTTSTAYANGVMVLCTRMCPCHRSTAEQFTWVDKWGK